MKKRFTASIAVQIYYKSNRTICQLSQEKTDCTEAVFTKVKKSKKLCKKVLTKGN